MSVACADEISVIKIVRGELHVERKGDRAAALVGAPVDRADRIVTGEDGSVGISFADSSILSAGPKKQS